MSNTDACAVGSRYSISLLKSASDLIIDAETIIIILLLLLHLSQFYYIFMFQKIYQEHKNNIF